MTALFLYGNALSTKLLLKYLGLDLPFREYFFLTALTSLLNIVIPFRGGAVFQAVYLKKNHGFQYTKSIVLNIVNQILSFLILALINIVNLLLLRPAQGPEGRGITAVLIFFAGLFAVCLFLLFIPCIKIRLPFKRLNDIVNRIVRGWRVLSRQKNGMLYLCLLLLAAFVISLLQIRSVYSGLGADLGLFQLILVNSMNYFSILMYITPGNLGIQEGLFLLSSYILNLKALESVMASLLMKSAWFTVTLLFSVPGFFLFLRKRTR